MPETVYVAIETGGYDEGDIVVGVFASLEAAQRAHQVGDRKGGIAEWTNCGSVESPYWTTRHGNVNIEPHKVQIA